MKLYVVSDLHLEESPFVPPQQTVEAADVIVLPGDIHPGVDGIRWARDVFGDKPIVYVAGNHEYWQGDWDLTLAEMRTVAKECGVHFLENESVVIDGVRFLGCSLWTDYEYFGADRKKDAIKSAKSYLPDYDYVTVDAGREFLTPEHTIARHKQSLAWLTGELNAEFVGSTVVVTHHFPHKNSCNPAHVASMNTAAYGSKLPEELLRRANLWLHGHTHHNASYRIGDSQKYVRVMCNPRGVPYLWYSSYENEAFNPHLLVEQLPDRSWVEHCNEGDK
jgi:predicted phosphohydrolase